MSHIAQWDAMVCVYIQSCKTNIYIERDINNISSNNFIWFMYSDW